MPYIARPLPDTPIAEAFPQAHPQDAQGRLILDTMNMGQPTERELWALGLIAQGVSAQVAGRLGGLGIIASAITDACRRLNARTRGQAVRIAVETGLLAPPGPDPDQHKQTNVSPPRLKQRRRDVFLYGSRGITLSELGGYYSLSAANIRRERRLACYAMGACSLAYQQEAHATWLAYRNGVLPSPRKYPRGSQYFIRLWRWRDFLAHTYGETDIASVPDSRLLRARSRSWVKYLGRVDAGDIPESSYLPTLRLWLEGRPADEIAWRLGIDPGRLRGDVFHGNAWFALVMPPEALIGRCVRTPHAAVDNAATGALHSSSNL